jgi:beta-glucosidase/6-phospho-beta-glucosidase/beta-galactosidase
MDAICSQDEAPFNPFFMFATGVDSSCPKIAGQRVDPLESSGHYARWAGDIDLVRDIGTRYLRYGPPLYRTFTGPGCYDWEFADLTFGHIRRHDLIPIADLCRFGVPDWIGDFQNPDFPALFAGYARAFAERFPWVQLYTPVSEIYISALFSALYGLWNEALKTDRAFVTALKHLAAANVLAMREILNVRPDAIFIQSERTGYYHADSPHAIGPAEIMNSVRFLSLDLSYGHRVDSDMYEYLTDNGMTVEEYRFFMGTRLSRHCVLGTDYYADNERRVSADGSRRAAGETLGYDDIVRQYQQRYGLPVMHTETSSAQGRVGDEAVEWLWKEWANALRVRNSGVPLVGFTWYPLFDQIDWHGGLHEQRPGLNPVGLYDLNRKIRPVGVAYTKLIRQWQTVLPTHSVCLIVPVLLPSEYDEPMARRRREWIHRFYRQPASATLPNPFFRETAALTTP